MSHCSDVIKPIRQYEPVTMEEAATRNVVVWEFEDTSVTIFPKLPSGKSCRVHIILRELIKRINGRPAIFKVCRNAGKWSYKITYAFKDKPTTVNAITFIKEAKRMGASDSQILNLMES